MINLITHNNMKNSMTTLLLFFVLTTCFSQNSTFEYNGRFTPSIKKEKLSGARFICELMPEFSRYVSMPHRELDELHQLLKSVCPPQRNYGSFLTYPPDTYIHIQENYEQVIDYVSIEILTTSNGKTLAAQSSTDALTNEQKNILNSADLGSDICIKIKFNYKKWVYKNISAADTLKEAFYSVTVVPATEAEYPGGFKQLTSYLTTNIFDKISDKNGAKKIQQAVVKFTVNEEGQLMNVKLSRMSTDSRTDQLILDAIQKMPRWKPAKNYQGVKVKQEMSIPFRERGC
jgi:TonB family protein